MVDHRSFVHYVFNRILWTALTRWTLSFFLLAWITPHFFPTWPRPIDAAWCYAKTAIVTRMAPEVHGAPMATSASHAAAEEPCFGPEDRCGDVVVREIARAKRAVRVQAFTFTARDIAGALVEARRRGVDVRVILDANEARHSAALVGALLDAGVVLRLDGAHGLAHNKVVILDDDEVLTGSFNFSAAAERVNAENLLVLRGDGPLARAYLANWDAHSDHSAPAGAALLMQKR